MQFPFLTVIILTQIAAAMVLLLLPAERKTEVRMLAAAATFFSGLLSILLYLNYQFGGPQYQFVELIPWVPDLGISYHLGVDGMSLPLMALTGIVSFTGVLISWGIEDRPREFFAFLLLLVAGVYGVFASLDLFLLFFFYELAVFPMYLLIGIWGSTRKEYAAMKLTLYLLIGSVISLVGALAMYFSAPVRSFDLLELQKAGFAQGFQVLWFLPVFLGFAILAGLWPFHNWSPDGHVAAPTAVSMLHAGVLMKLGAYAALRVGIVLLPEGAKQWLPFIVLLTVVNVVYGALIAMVQRDFKYVIGFSSVSHMGLVSMGFATMNLFGFTGAAYQMVSHGIMTALFFAVVGMIYDRAHTRQIPELGGMMRVMPWAGVAFIVGGLVSMGMPGLSGFMAEFPIFLGVWRAGNIAPWYPVIAILSSLGIVFTAAYVLRIVGKVFFGPVPQQFTHLSSLTALDKTALAILVTLLIVLGLFPQIMVPMIQSGAKPIVAALSAAGTVAAR